MNKSLTFSLSTLIDKETGANELYSLDVDADFEGDINLKSTIVGKVEIMRIEDGFNALAKNITLTIELPCGKCLEKYDTEIVIKRAERQFYLDAPQKVEDINDLYLVDKKRLQIDITEMLRQEIILHFPVIQVCSTRCEGICPKCGSNRNKKRCNCKVEDEHLEQKPLAALKELLK